MIYKDAYLVGNDGNAVRFLAIAAAGRAYFNCAETTISKQFRQKMIPNIVS